MPNNRELGLNMTNIWAVKKTECYPNGFKVYPVKLYLEDNQLSNYFATYEEAVEEARKRNLRHNAMIKEINHSVNKTIKGL